MKLRTLVYTSLLVCAMAACTDEVKFGNSFLEKAPGGSVTQDTVFGNAEYTRQYLASIYTRQFFGLTLGTANYYQKSASGWNGKVEALSDCWQLHYQSAKPYNYYYSGTLTANDVNIFDFANEYIWETVRWSWVMLENIDRVPDMGEAEKNRIKAEVRCIIASRYFDAFQNYGGLPLVRGSFAASTSEYDLPRATAEETLEYMVDMLDEAISTSELPWAYTGNEADTETGHWTKAGAMALKCRILAFAASPIFNNEQGYYGGSTTAEQQHLVWYGGYKPEYWTRLKTACEDFFTALARNGHYTLQLADGTRPQDYRLAFRKAYFVQSSPEVLHSVRVTTKSVGGSDFNWFYWLRIGRNSYNPTQEYIEMFPWSDGTPFDWDATAAAGKLDEMFLKGDQPASGKGKLENVVLTRDPRLYETCSVNGMNKSLDWTTAEMRGNIYEMWVGGTDAQNNSLNETGKFATGYFIMKYSLGDSDKSDANPDIAGHNFQWVTLRLSEMYLLYAEALLQTGDLPGALQQIDLVRNRVGLGGLAACNPTKNLTSNKNALLAELLRERACELGFENSRWYDLVRYRLGSVLEKPLHGLLIHRLKEENGEWVNDDTKWTGTGERRTAQPTHFSYEKFELKNRARVWWTDGFNPKWYLQPFPQTEVNKNYGLIQNPGW